MRATRIPTHTLRGVFAPTEHTHQGLSPYTLPGFGIMYWSRLDRALRYATRHAPRRDGPLTVVDLGCGVGVFLRSLTDAFAGARVLGVDPSERRVLETARSLWPDGEAPPLARGDAERIALKSASVDVLACLDVLEHVPDPRRALDEIRRVVRPDGVFVVSVPTEGAILRAARRVYFRKNPDDLNADPHWHGTVADIDAFFEEVASRFRILESFYVPTGVRGRAWNYGRVAACRPLS